MNHIFELNNSVSSSSRFPSCSVVNHLDHILQQIVIKVLIQWKHEMHWNLLWIHNLHCLANEPIAISVLVLIVHQCSWLHSCWLVLVQVTAEPCLLSYDLLCLIVDVVNWSFEWLSILEIKSSEHASRAQISLINDQLLVLFTKTELSLSDDGSLNVQNVIILNNTQILVLVLISLVADTDHHENISGSLPHCVKRHLNISKAIWDADLLFNLVLLVSNDVLGVFVDSQIISSEIPFVIVAGLEPGNHGMMVGLFNDVLVSPFSVLKLFLMDGLWIFLERVIVVSQLKSVVIVSTNFLDTEVLSVSESNNVWLVGFFVEEVLGCSSEFVGFQVQNQDTSLVLLCAFRAQIPFASGFKHNEFSVRNHAGGIEGNGENILEENLTSLINVDDTVLSKSSNTEKDIGVIESWIEIQDFSVLFGKVDFWGLWLEKHKRFILLISLWFINNWFWVKIILW